VLFFGSLFGAECFLAAEHLLCYARLKGVEPHAETAVVQQIAEAVELDGDAFGMISSTLSGGMKRRLSIGISLLGGPKVWLLDEPTTGCDVSARRDVWRIINRQKTPDRAIVMYAHCVQYLLLCSAVS
jgi:ABC-type multidrug transport system ATPase subunit